MEITEIQARSGAQFKAVLVWLVLLASTITAWLESSALSLTAVVVMTGLALIKVLLVVYSYMEVGTAARWLQVLCGIWVLAVFGMILLCYSQPELLAGWLR